MAIFRCITEGCNTIWRVEGVEGTDNSHGLCPTCAKQQFIPIFRKRQLREGNFDCFARAAGYCDQTNCFYRSLCLAERPDQAVISGIYAQLASQRCLSAYMTT
jgi:hypothetical protein